MNLLQKLPVKRIAFLCLTFIFLVENLSAQMLISEYIEGTSGNRGVEIYNNTISDIDLTDYTLQIYLNGSNAPNFIIDLSGTIASDDVYVVCYSGATQAMKDLSDLITPDFAINGDDDVAIFKNGVVLDYFGQNNVDPGSAYGTCPDCSQNQTLRRKAGTTEGDTNITDPFDPADEYDSFPTNDLSGLGSPDPLVLPVELTKFKAGIVNSKVKLDWETATEINNRGFEIQKSHNGTDWNKIGFEKGAGNSYQSVRYSFLDQNPYPGINYYRLRQIDFDDRFEFSNVVSVDFHSSKYSFTVFPNTSSDLVNLNMEFDETAELRLFNSVGEIIFEKTVIERILQMDISQWQSGNYFIQLKTEAGIWVERLIKP